MHSLAVTGIVLAGGRSSRFGSDKLAAELDGRPLLHHALEAVASCCDEVVVVLAPTIGLDLPGGLVGRVRVVHDPEPFGGPLVGVGAGLAVARHPLAIVVGGDMPRLSPAVLDLLVRALDQDGDGEGSARRAAAVLEVADGSLQPLPMALRVEPALRAYGLIRASGGRALRQLLDRLMPAVVGLDDWSALDHAAGTILDIDRPSDLLT